MLQGKPAPKEDPAEHARRMEQYMREALRNIHCEEAGRITATMLTDVSVKTQRKMLATRIQFLQLEREEGREEEGDEEGDFDDAVTSTTNLTTAGITHRHQHQHAVDRARWEALGELAEAFEVADSLDPASCNAEQLAATLRAMMVADIVDLRQLLEREAQELKDLRQLKAECNRTRAGTGAERKKRGPTAKHTGSSAATALEAGQSEGQWEGSLLEQEVAAAEERARLTLSEEIVDMLEAKYGTAQHSGEPPTSLSSKRCSTEFHPVPLCPC